MSRTFSKMEPGHKSTWLEALRSGKYKQGQGHLRQSNGQDVFCCLGVLQDVIQPEDWVKPEIHIGLEHDSFRAWSVPEVGMYDEDAYDPDNDNPSLNDGEIQERLMDETNFDNKAMAPLISLNDGQRPDGDPSKPRVDIKSFGEIADWIEENL